MIYSNEIQDELYEALENAQLQIEYLHQKFQETGSGNAVLANIKRALANAKKEDTEWNIAQY